MPAPLSSHSFDCATHCRCLPGRCTVAGPAGATKRSSSRAPATLSGCSRLGEASGSGKCGSGAPASFEPFNASCSCMSHRAMPLVWRSEACQCFDLPLGLALALHCKPCRHGLAHSCLQPRRHTVSCNNAAATMTHGSKKVAVYLKVVGTSRGTARLAESDPSSWTQQQLRATVNAGIEQSRSQSGQQA